VHGNVRFGVAVHTLVMLALFDEPQNSTRIAESVDTNPVVIRRILGLLERAGLVHGRTGPGGGFRLARPAHAITLEQVFRAVEASGAAPAAHRPNRKCPVGRTVSVVLAAIGKRAERAFLSALAGQTLADAVGQVRRGAGAGLS
jgi:Rrf2 family protein